MRPNASDMKKKGLVWSKSRRAILPRCQAAQQSRTGGNTTVEVLLNSASTKAINERPYQTAPLRRFRNTAATARAALNAAAIKANVGSDVTADGLPDRALKSFPAHPTKVWG